jgi:hypothetical protein
MTAVRVSQSVLPEHHVGTKGPGGESALAVICKRDRGKQGGSGCFFCSGYSGCQWLAPPCRASCKCCELHGGLEVQSINTGESQAGTLHAAGAPQHGTTGVAAGHNPLGTHTAAGLHACFTQAAAAACMPCLMPRCATNHSQAAGTDVHHKYHIQVHPPRMMSARIINHRQRRNSVCMMRHPTHNHTPDTAIKLPPASCCMHISICHTSDLSSS